MFARDSKVSKLLGSLSFGLALLTMAFTQISIAQEADPAGNVEEILVTGERSLRSMRLQMETAEAAVFDVFNEIYADTDYEMICVRERPAYDSFNPSASQWTVRTCRSRLAHEINQELLEEEADYLSAELDGGVGAPVDNTYFVEQYEEHSAELFEKIEELLVENPEYREKFKEYILLKLAYDEAVEEDFEEGNFLTRLFR